MTLLARRFGAIGLSFAMLSAATSAQSKIMTGAEIQKSIIGHTIYLAAPITGEFPLNYRRNGTVDGNGTALGLGQFLKPTDSGHWSISGDQLCQQFTSWYKGARFCFKLTMVNAGSVKWVRNDGDSGVARIGN